MTVKVTANYFAGSARIHQKETGGLGDVVRRMLQSQARDKLAVAGVPDLTDNSTGAAVASGTLADMVIPTAAYDGTSSGAAPATAFNTAAGVVENVGAVLADALNNARVRLGLPLITWTTGTIAAANTIPAMTKALTATSGATAVDYATGVDRMTSLRKNVHTLARAMNEVLEAAGRVKMNLAPLGGEWDYSTPYALDAVADATAGTGDSAGETSISDTVMDAFLDAAADNVATMAYVWNARMTQAGITDLTDNSGGTAESPLASAGADFTAHQDGGTDTAPKAGWDAEMAKLENNFADLAARTNELLGRYGLAPLVDGTTGTANTTLEVIDDSLTAVDGTGGGADGLELASANTQKGVIEDNVATLMVEVNRLCPYFGVVTVVDSFGGTADGGKALGEIGTSAAAVNNSAAATGVADAEADAFLDRVTDAMATMAAKLNEMTGTEVDMDPLTAVAALG